jgi:Uma2 family endonuclease
MTATLKRPPARMTVAEFLTWDNGDASGARWQLVDGEPVAVAPASEVHGAIQAELVLLIGAHLRDTGRPCRVVVEPGIVPKVRSSENFRVPDLGVTCAPAGWNPVMPEPVLLIEVMSLGNEAETRANIWTYVTIPSVREILIVHSTRVEAELLRRQDDETWPDAPAMVGRSADIALASIGFTAPLVAVYRTTPLAAPFPPP